MTELARMDVGFQGGQVLSLRATVEEHAGLRKALEGGQGWHELRTQDSELMLDLSQVVYVRRDVEADRVGF